MRKVRGFTVTDELFAAIAKGARHVPESARFSHAFFDYERSTFVCIFEDESFSPVPEGCRIPVDSDDSFEVARAVGEQ